MTDVAVIRETFNHMGGHSGYDQLCRSLDVSGVSLHSVWRKSSLPQGLLKQAVVNFFFKHLPNKVSFYGPLNLWTELCSLKKTLTLSDVVHVLYGENNLGLYSIPMFKGRNKLVVTIHQPYSWWQSQGVDLKKKFAHVDALFVLSRSEKKHFDKLLGANRVHYVPHGVDTDFFCPGDNDIPRCDHNQTVRRYLFVGQWLRDFDTLFSVIELNIDKKSNVEFDLVVPDLCFRDLALEERIRKLSGLPEVTRHQKLDDVSLRELYRKATLLLMPLKESTANNAILEAMACGLPVVTSETTGIKDYVDSSFARICPLEDAEAMNLAAEEISSCGDTLGEMSFSARKRALDEFSWSKVGNSAVNIYHSIK